MDRLNDCANTAEAEVASLRRENERLRTELADAKTGGREWRMHPRLEGPDSDSLAGLCTLHGILSFGTLLILAAYYVFVGPTPEIVRAAMVVPPITASWFIAWMRREVAK